MTCPRCKGLGFFLVVLKPRSVGISTMAIPGNKTVCPDCKGTGAVTT